MKTYVKPKVYGIDLDGVCFDFMGAFITHLNGELDMHLTKAEITSYYWHETTDVTKEQFMVEFDRFGEEGHGYRNLDILPGALKGLKQLHSAGHKIYYITNRPEYALQDTIDCLEEHGLPQRENLHFAKGKKAPLVKKFAVDVFIDDSPSTIVELTTETRAEIYCRSYKFNEHLDDTFFKRVNGWEDFMKGQEV
tara:strand:- start:7 stop:588 length:582 start_codon:yes stop_codon:yes gene_type:complete